VTEAGSWKRETGSPSLTSALSIEHAASSIRHPASRS
jgi:hypothetical protein